LVPVSRAKAHLSELVREAEDTDVVLMRHSEMTAVLISVERYNQLLEEIEDLRDRLSVHEREHLTADWGSSRPNWDSDGLLHERFARRPRLSGPGRRGIQPAR
jgi:prevent-host-death family protein